jgi:hypothetical protein
MNKECLSVGIMECLKSMYEAIELCVKWGRDQVKQWIPQQVRNQQVCTLSPFLSSIFTGDIVDYTKEVNRHLILVGKITTSELLFPVE